MAVTVILDLYVKPEAVDDVIADLKADLPDTRAYEGNLRVDVLRNQDDLNHITLVERWEQRVHQEKYAAWRAESGNLEKIAAAMTAPLKVTYFEEMQDL